MAFELFDHQQIVIDKLDTGSILCGGVGSGKSLTALSYYFIKEGKGSIKIKGKSEFTPMRSPKNLYIITTARKRDTLEWDKELAHFLLSTNPELSYKNTIVKVDSWNNIKKYIDIKDSFFIFDEQRLVGSGTWVKAFLKITKKNNWILLTATPGDTWMDYVPVFIANGFYKNRTEFIRRHAVYNRFTRYPKIDHYIECGRLVKLRKQITVNMSYTTHTTAHNEIIIAKYDKPTFDKVMIERWNIFENKPIKDIAQVCYLMRRVVNSDLNRLLEVKKIIDKHPKVIIFYNFDYELELLRELSINLKIPTGEWNGHKHEHIPNTNSWIYLVQYTAGAEGWNCIETNVIIFYSQNYSYKTMKQAAGRIDRLNTKFNDLYYYHIKSNSVIDQAISKALTKKQNFNEYKFMNVR